jgi:ABC-type polysaccharide/polyol phosphate transport system ATPase subunit
MSDLGQITKDQHARLAIHLDEVAVYYQLQPDRPMSLKERLIHSPKGEGKMRHIKALDGVSLQIQAGEIFGIVGRNGAGKSTLLKLISGIIWPSQGRVRVWGKIAPLLAVGAGFNYELTGRENVYLYAAVLGRKLSDTARRFDEIVEFAELDRFIDSPLRVYSTGMVARLGFSVAMAEKPDILLVDEVLGVGDEQFRIKCQAKFNDFRQAGTTIVIVTHQMNLVETLCPKAIWLVNGRVESQGSGAEVVGAYRKFARQAKIAGIPNAAG